MRTDLVPVGYMYPGRWRHIADVYAESGMLQVGFPLAGFLYEPDTLHIPPWVYWSIGGVFALAGMAMVVVEKGSEKGSEPFSGKGVRALFRRRTEKATVERLHEMIRGTQEPDRVIATPMYSYRQATE